jgi:hypothetical protein
MMKVEKKVNRMWQEWNSMPAKLQKEIRWNVSFIGKWQYSYSSERGKIDMIRMSEGFPKKTFWEICCLEGNLFGDTERFDTKKEAERRIRQLLEGKRKEIRDSIKRRNV